MQFAAAIKRAAEGSPIHTARTPAVAGRVLAVDGDALCYSCAGTDDTDPGQARINVLERIRRAMAASAAASSEVLVTGRGSHKGFRYAVATVKPYQGQREGSRRPKNWEHLRSLVETGVFGDTTEVTAIAEADDLFARNSAKYGAENYVIHTQDKDMRMVPGYHLTWDDFLMTYVPPGTWEHKFNDKVYGRKWFWLQMLHGDAADYIPGLPKFADGSLYKSGPDKGKLKYMLCGEATATKLLSECKNEEDARAEVMNLYRSYYAESALEAMLEQAVLLWMRVKPGNVFDVCDEGNPMCGLDAARPVIMQRIAQAQAYQES